MNPRTRAYCKDAGESEEVMGVLETKENGYTHPHTKARHTTGGHTLVVRLECGRTVAIVASSDNLRAMRDKEGMTA